MLINNIILVIFFGPQNFVYYEHITIISINIVMNIIGKIFLPHTLEFK